MADPALPTLGDEAERRRGLRIMRRVALGLLLLAALIFLLTHTLTDLTGIWGFIGRASEAAMIGAIADWFAVTALFRHPLGLKIPHTAIIPRRKDALGASLSTFVADNFLRAEVVSDKIRRAGVSARVADWLMIPASRRTLADRGAQAIGYALDRIDEDEVRGIVEGVVVPKLVEAEKAPILGHLLGDLVSDGSHHRLVELVIEELQTWLELNPQLMDQLVSSRAPSWAPGWINEQIAGRLRREILGWIAEVRRDPRHRVRQALDGWLMGLAEDLQADTPSRDKLERVLADLLVRQEVSDGAVALWRSGRDALRRAIDDPDSALRPRLEGIIGELAETLHADAELQARIDERLATVTGDLAQTFGPEIASVISDTIARWDATEASERIELFVGRDLQYIRINGTVIGALVGIVIHAVTLVL